MTSRSQQDCAKKVNSFETQCNEAKEETKALRVYALVEKGFWFRCRDGEDSMLICQAGVLAPVQMNRRHKLMHAHEFGSTFISFFSRLAGSG